MTADEHLQVIVGQMIVQIAMLKAEVDRLTDLEARRGHERLTAENERVPT
jgi:hypothetical protein